MDLIPLARRAPCAVLTAELVEARPRGDVLRLTALTPARHATAVALAREVLTTYREHVGLTREVLAEAIGELPVSARERRLFLGLAKLVDDEATFEGGALLDVPPDQLRAALFTDAAAARRDECFDRAALLAEHAARHGVTADVLERALYADLRGAEVLRAVAPEEPEALVARWQHAQVQAVLLRAVEVVVEVEAADPADARALFHRLKFLRLLWRLERGDAGRWRITIDGPLSLFESVTRYGLELAMLVPVLDRMRAYTLTARLRWGKSKTALTFTHQGGSGSRGPAAGALPDEVQALLDRLTALGGPWQARVASEILDLPGVGLVVPDLVLERDGARVFVEVLGHWSRGAVWRRVELVEAGLGAPLVVAVSERLRVSEEVLPAEAPACLYVYKGVMSAKAVVERAERLRARG